MKCLSNYKLFTIITLFIFSCQNEPIACDVLIYNGTVYDGSGEKPYLGSVGITDDKITYVGKNTRFEADTIIDATNLSVSPGFINMLSWGYSSLMEDGRSLSDLKQGVTLEVFGEGVSPGPYVQEGERFSFKDAMEALENSGVSTNIASFLGATTARMMEVGFENRPATEKEMEKMKQMVQESMEQGAMGIGSSLIYAPADYAPTQELVELCRVASKNGGMYISHMRNEDNLLMEALEELITISREADIPSQIYHLGIDSFIFMGPLYILSILIFL